MKNIKSQSGFTLIEMLVYSTVVSVAFIIIGNIVLQVNRVQNRLSSERFLQQQTIFLSNKLSYNIHNAAQIEEISPEQIKLVTQDLLNADTEYEYKFYKFENGSLWYAHDIDPNPSVLNWTKESDDAITITQGNFIVKDNVLIVDMELSKNNTHYNFKATYAVRQPSS